jgi:predicted glycoside hydrolase/deacetylase ChbG (UPF0249 family)/SAM-dependent methyltransferase
MALTLLTQRPDPPAPPPSVTSQSSAPDRALDSRISDALGECRARLDQRGFTISLSGLDGSGKTTMARELAAALRDAGIAVRTHHVYRLLSNLLWTPRVIRRAHRESGVQIFDRGIHDNIAHLLAHHPHWPNVMKRWLIRFAQRYPACDLRVLMHTDAIRTRARRPEVSTETHARFDRAYRRIATVADLEIIESDAEALHQVLTRFIAAVQARTATLRTVILHADDLGLTYAFNEGIRRAHLHGLLTSTSLRANGWAYRHAVDHVLPVCPRLAIGLHLCLNEAEPVAPRAKVSRLLDRGGRLRSGYGWLMRLAATSIGKQQIERELRAQIERVLADGVAIDHFDSHQHVHMIPAIFHLVCRLACEYGVANLRLTREPSHVAPGYRRRWQPRLNGNLIKHHLLNHFARRNRRTADAFGLRYPDAFVGVRYTGAMDIASVLAGLDAAHGRVVEVLLHPARGPDPRDVEYPADYLRGYVRDPRRATELAALTSADLARALRSRGWQPGDPASTLGGARCPQPAARTPVIPTTIRQLCAETQARNPLWVSTAQADARAFAEIVLSQVGGDDHVLDLGTGSGILAICLARRGIAVTASDVSCGAVATARRNARAAGVEFPCVASDLLTDVTGTFDTIAFNIPYNFGPDSPWSNVAKNLARRIPWICRNSGAAIPAGVLRFHRELIDRLIPQAQAHLRPQGQLLLHVFDFEVGIFQRGLPESAAVDVLRHPQFTAHRTVAMRIRFNTAA